MNLHIHYISFLIHSLSIEHLLNISESIFNDSFTLIRPKKHKSPGYFLIK